MFGLLARLWPKGRCQACLLPLAAGSGDLKLCPACLDGLRPFQGQLCPVCAGTPQRFGSLLCPRCSENPRPFVQTAFYAGYAGLMRELILAYKFENRLELARPLGAMLLQGFLSSPLAKQEFDILIPAPLHPKRLAERGYNQSLEICRELGARLKLKPNNRALARIRYTVPQSRLGLAERLGNPRGAFEANPHLVDGKRVLLVDDIMTTGATLEAAAKSLNQAGASSVRVLVLARSRADCGGA